MSINESTSYHAYNTILLLLFLYFFIQANLHQAHTYTGKQKTLNIINRWGP
jgi:hypothetical protein